MAEGGKSEEGILKEKRACSLDDRPASVLGVATCEDERAEKKVRKIGKKIRQKSTRRRRGGRIAADGWTLKTRKDEKEGNRTRK
jgi:hypothetical protein